MTSPELIVLGLIAEKASYGYELEENIQKRGMRHWTEIGFSSIYNTLAKLEKKQLIESTIDKQFGAPDRKVYRITKDGRTVLSWEIMGILSIAQPWINRLDIGLCFANILDRGVLKDCLRNYQQSLTELRDQLLQALEIYQPDQQPANIRAIFSHQLHFIESEMTWVDRQINT